MADEVLQQIAIESDGEPRTFTVKGKPFKCTIANMRDLGEFTGLLDKREGRMRALKAMKGKLAVTIPREVFEGLEDKLPSAVKLTEDKLEVYLTSEREVDAATIVELCLRKPAMTWPRAVLFIKLNAMLAAAIVQEFQNINGEVALAEAKKGSGSKTSQPPEEPEA